VSHDMTLRQATSLVCRRVMSRCLMTLT
jgi:hypothetical protein